MGINVSRQVELSENEYLKKFVGKDHIPPTDNEFWDTFLQYHIAPPTNSQEQLSLDSRLETLCQSFISHNLSSGNFGSLIAVFLNKVTQTLILSDKDSSIHVWQAFNALFIIRCLIKYMIETGSEYQLLQHFEALPIDNPDHVHATKSVEVAEIATEKTNTTIDIEGAINSIKPSKVSVFNEEKLKSAALTAKNINRIIDGTKFDLFFDAIVNIIIIIPVKEFTYHLNLEAVNTIITLLSVFLFTENSTDKSIIFKTIYKCQHANTLMSVLLHFVSRMVPVPQTMFGINTGGSFVYGIAESLWSMLTFRKTQDLLLTSTDLITDFKEHYPLTNQSLLLILILTNHYTTKENPYRKSLFECCDSKDTPKEQPSFKIDFTNLYTTLCRIITINQSTLLLYLLLHRNQRFYKYVITQINIQELVIPILQKLYNAPDSTSHHIYMSLIILLILSEDDGFNKFVHQIMLKNITWYTERTIQEISLGGLLILVVIRTIQYNMLKMRDKYLHTNCLAALANMSGQFRSLHPYVAQRLVSLFETLARKHARLDLQLKETTNVNGVSNPTTFINVNSTTPEDMDLNVLEEVLRMVLEILNSCLTNQLIYCPNLVYTLLYKRNVFEVFRHHRAFEDVIQNIDMVVGFFSSRLQRVQDQRGELGVNEVLEVISKGASQWSSDRLRKFPDLKFKYVEEDAPEEFFIPYVWLLVCKLGSVHFSSEIIKTGTTNINC